MKEHNMWWMMLACLIPLLIAITLPFFGFDKGYTTLIFIALMIGAHIFMMYGKGGMGGCCGGHGGSEQSHNEEDKKDPKPQSKHDHH